MPPQLILVSFFEEVNFEIIFVTAYDQYAIKAFEVSAVDYLLKPVEIDRLKCSVKKLITKAESNIAQTNYKILTENLKSENVSQIIVRHKGEQAVIAVKDIIAIEAKEAYSRIHTSKGNFLASKNLKHFETVLNQNNTFFRTHKSWIINLSYLVKFSKSKLEIELTTNIFAKLSKYKASEFGEKLIE